jgi:predicted transcriptional regulator
MPDLLVPLADAVYRELCEEAARACRPATAVARQAIEHWLHDRRRVARHEAIAAFAAENAGSSLDLDAELEAASEGHLLATKRSKR